MFILPLKVIIILPALFTGDYAYQLDLQQMIQYHKTIFRVVTGRQT